MELQRELDALANQVASFQTPPKVSEEAWQTFADKAVVALMAGGESSRFAAVLDGKNVQKNALELPNGDTMIEMNIRVWRDAGIKNFVALVFHNAHSIEERLGDGSQLGVHITYSYDPEKPVGKGGAVRNALDNGSIPVDSYLIVVNPDDVILDFPGNFARFFGEAFLAGQVNGMLATAALAPGRPYSWTGMMVVDNAVVDTQMYPFIPVPAHVGITIFSPKVLPRFRELFPLEQKTEFEEILFPLLAKEKTLWSAGLTEGTWIAVNDLKAYKQLVAHLEAKTWAN
jgi:NDP-sugar pyrophosphorylase family protein